MIDKTEKQKTPRNLGGRPTVKTPETAKRICKALALGMPFRKACVVARISYATFCEWRNESEELRQQMEQAISVGIEKHLARIEKAAESDWRASAWWLERCHPQEFSRNRLEITGAGGRGLGLAVGIQIVLPEKADPLLTADQVERLALPEGRSTNGDGD
jgi:hypothetical protein